jgi:hypothetical protein
VRNRPSGFGLPAWRFAAWCSAAASPEGAARRLTPSCGSTLPSLGLASTRPLTAARRDDGHGDAFPDSVPLALVHGPPMKIDVKAFPNVTSGLGRDLVDGIL